MTTQKYSAPAASRLLDIFEVMVKEDKSYTVTELSNVLNISTNSVFRIMKEIEARNYIQKNSADNSYILTQKLYYLGSAVGNRFKLINLSRNSMRQLAKYTRETTLLVILNQEYNTVVVEQIESPEPLKFVSTIGHAYPTHSSAMGKAILAYINSNAWEEYIKKHGLSKFTDNTITTCKDFKIELQKIKNQGWAADMEETCIGLRCIGAPIFDAHSQAIGAIGISGPISRITDERFSDFIENVKKTASYISELMGHI